MEKIKSLVPELSINSANYSEALKLFNEYRRIGVIQSSNFDSNKWYLTNQYNNYTFSFHINENDYKDYEELLNIKRNEFVKYIKIYVIYRLGLITLETFREFLSCIKKIVSTDADSINEVTISTFQTLNFRIKEFFIFITSQTNNEEAKNYICDQIDYAVKYSIGEKSKKQRLLASYDSYTRVSEIIDMFWKECSNIKEKIYFFPIWFWWKVSGCIPMRPKEIVLTPKKCLEFIKGEWRITIRKSAIKGSNKRKSYSINEDYFTYTFYIQDELADVINWYINETQHYNQNDLDTLFAKVMDFPKQKKYTYKNYYTYLDLAKCLNDFYELIIKQRYGFTIIDDIEKIYLEDNEIQKIRLGDTRHLAAQNALHEGASVAVVKILLGDSDDSIAAHYLTNISKYIECRTYRFKKKIGSTHLFGLSTYEKPPKIGEYVEVKEGWCYSAKYRDNNFEDCDLVSSPNGELGFCSKCHYFRAKNKSFENSAKKYTNAIKEDCDNLKNMVSKYKKGTGTEEDIIEALQLLRNKEKEYEKYLLEVGDEVWEEKEK